MPFRYGAVTHNGKKRAKNEDYICVHDADGIYVLCDGVGGSHHSGDVASRTAAESWVGMVSEWVKQKPHFSWAPAKIAAALNQMTQDVNQQVCDKKGMATTFEAVWLQGEHAWLCHIGDSRIYLLRAGELHQLTEDHTFENEWIKSGTYTPETAAKSPHAKALTQAIGAQGAVKVDIRRVELMAEDRLLLCSDGLNKMVDDRQILSVIQKCGSDMPKAAQALVDLANDRGGIDNISAIVIEPLQHQVQSSTQTNLMIQPKAEIKPAVKPAKLNPQIKIEAMARVPFFHGLEYSELLKLLEIAELEVFKPGELLTEEGTPGDEMFVLISGEVEVYRNDRYIGVRTAGMTVGEMGVMDQQERSATVRARDLVTALAFPREKFMTLLSANSHLALKVMWKIVLHLVGLTRDMTRKISGG